MHNDMEGLIKEAFSRWNKERPRAVEGHPDEEEFAAFIDGALSEEQALHIKEHILGCDACTEVLKLSITGLGEGVELPEGLLERVKGMVIPEDKSMLFEIALRIKDGIMEFINTSGDVLVGQELLPAPVLRSRSINNFKDEVRILKDIKDFRIEVKVEAKSGESFNLAVLVKEKRTQKVMKNLRISLIKGSTELESYVSTAGAVIFEHVLLGDYRIDVSRTDEKVALITLNIKA